MISRNAKLTQVNNSVYDIRVICTEMDEFYNKNGEDCHVEISKPKAHKSYQQLKFIHSLMTALFLCPFHSYTSKSLDDYKLALKKDFGIYRIVEIKGDKYIHAKSLSKYSRYELSEFIGNVVSFAYQCEAYPGDKKVAEIIDGATKDKIINT